MAVANTVDAAKDAAGGLKSLSSLGSVSASVGFSKSKSTSATSDQTVVGSSIAGGDVNITATGPGAAGTINVIGSTVAATRDLTVTAPGAITFAAAQEVDTSSSKNKSSGASLGVTLSSSGLSPTASLSLGKGNSSGKDVTNIESVLAAGGTARVVTPNALSLEGAQLSANRVEVSAGSLAITSQQDTAVFKSKQTSVGVSVSADFGKSGSGTGGQGRSFNGAGASASFGSTRQSGDFASVQEQSGIKAGSGGFDIKVAGATTLTGGVIASEAAPESNHLTTGTLAASDLTNREKFKASSINLSASISGIGKPKPAEGNSSGGNGGNGNGTQVPAGGDGNPNQGADRSRTTAGLRTGIGTIAAGLPSVASASGSQSSTTVSAIAAGGITLTGGDAASANVAQTISRDTSEANQALTKQFTESKREEIAQGFAATQALTQQIGIFFNNRASEEDDLRKRAADPNAVGADGRSLTAQQRLDLIADADKLRDQFGAGSAARIAATAFAGAAGSNVAGGLGSLVQGAAVNVLQSLAVTEVKKLADSIADPTAREATRAALQAVTACAGSAAGGSGGCGSAAVGAAASVALNLLLNSIDKDKPGGAPIVDANGNITNPISLEGQEARANLIGTLIAAIATGAGLDAQVATNAALIETENNASRRVRLRNGQTGVIADPGDPNGATVAEILNRYPPGDPGRAGLQPFINAYGTSDPVALQAIVNLLGQGISENDVRAAQAAANAVHGAGTPEAAQALVAINNGTTTTAALQTQADANRITISSRFTLGGVPSLLDPTSLRFCLTCTYDPGSLDVQQLFAQGSNLAGEGVNYLGYLNREYQLTTRGLGLLQGVGGAFGTLAAGTGTVASLPLCISVIGCAAPVGLGVLTGIEADQTVAGFRTFFTGRQTSSGLAQLAGSTGLVSEQNADTALGFAGLTTAVAGGGRAVVTRIGNDLDAPISGALDDAARQLALEAGQGSGRALESATFAQRTFSETFDPLGRFAGQTIDDVASGLLNSTIRVSDVPVEYIVRNGTTFILNTRSAQALERAGIPRSQWLAVNVTGNAAAEARLSGQIRRNTTPNNGFPAPRPSRGN